MHPSREVLRETGEDDADAFDEFGFRIETVEEDSAPEVDRNSAHISATARLDQSITTLFELFDSKTHQIENFAFFSFSVLPLK